MGTNFGRMFIRYLKAEKYSVITSVIIQTCDLETARGLLKASDCL